LHLAARSGRLLAVRYLVSAGLDVNLVDSFNRSVLLEASSRGPTDVVLELFRNGAKSSIISKAGYSALAGAAASGNLVAMKALVGNATDLVFGRCLLLASSNGHSEIAKFLALPAKHRFK